MAMDTGPASDTMEASPLDGRLRPELERLRSANLYRSRRTIEGRHGVEVRVDGRDCLSFCSNDYLGLASDPRLARAAARALDAVGTGSGAAALISGYNREHRRLEEALAVYTGYPRVLLFSTGWAANLGVLRGLLGKTDRLIADELNHASLIDGGRLSGAEYLRVPHADLSQYEQALRAPRDPGALGLLVTDSVFSMDGDLAPLPQLAALCRSTDTALMIDDAHGLGVLGARGRGAAEHCGVRPDIYVATLGKSLGCGGAFVAGSEALIETLIQRARSWVFSTAPPPAIAAAAREALRILDVEPERRARLHHNLERFVDAARQVGLALGVPGTGAPGQPLTPIQPVLIGDDGRAMRISRRLFERGYWVAAIRPPTVPRGTARLRVTLSAAHTDAQIDGLVEALCDCVRAEPG